VTEPESPVRVGEGRHGPGRPATADPGVAAMRRLHERVAAICLPASIGELYRARSAAMGDAPAAVWFESGRVLTYREMDAGADRVAWALLARGVRKGTHVAIMAAGGPLWLVLWGAIARLGAVLVPVNAAYTSSEAAALLEGADAQYLIIDDSLLPVLEGFTPWPPLLDESRIFVHGKRRQGLQSWSDLLESPQHGRFAAPWSVERNDFFNLQFTSGTTGQPKGCMLSHEYWLLTAAIEAEVFGRPLGVRRTLVWQPMFYMAAPWRAFMVFMLGGTMFIPDRMSASRFFGWLRDYRIEQCTFPEWVLEHSPASVREGELALRHVHAYGWNRQSHVEFERRFRCAARDSFGMSEVGIATETPLEASHMVGTGSCGLPNPFKEVRISDDSGKALEVGQTGELCIAGRGILTGYYQRPDANVASFHGRWFRTGDLARMDDAGYVYVVGRIKELIRRSGEGISAQEVEAVLRGIPGISEAAVVGVPDPQRVQEIKAYVKLSPGAEPGSISPAFILQHCARTLARYKCPRYVAYVDDFPRTPTRKIAKAELLKERTDPRSGAYDTVDGIWR